MNDCNKSKFEIKGLFVGNLNISTNEKSLYRLFSIFGEIELIKIVQGPPKNYAYVFYLESTNAEKAQLWLKDIELDNHCIRILPETRKSIRLTNPSNSLDYYNRGIISILP